MRARTVSADGTPTASMAPGAVASNHTRGRMGTAPPQQGGSSARADAGILPHHVRRAGDWRDTPRALAEPEGVRALGRVPEGVPCGTRHLGGCAYPKMGVAADVDGVRGCYPRA